MCASRISKTTFQTSTSFRITSADSTTGQKNNFLINTNTYRENRDIYGLVYSRSVSTTPGHIQLHVIPKEAASRAVPYNKIYKSSDDKMIDRQIDRVFNAEMITVRLPSTFYNILYKCINSDMHQLLLWYALSQLIVCCLGNLV